jgi:hypothetical protein
MIEVVPFFTGKGAHLTEVRERPREECGQRRVSQDRMRKVAISTLPPSSQSSDLSE